MHNDEEFELSPEERIMLAALPREMTPSDLLEERVVRSLKNEGHFGGIAPARRPIRNAWKIAAAIALFAGGVATGGYMMSSKSPAASATAKNTTRPSSAVPAKDTSIERKRDVAPKTETLVAERELWM
jgi:hypothetical protein